MPTFNYQKMVDTASSLLTKFGDTVTVTYATSTSYDVATQTYTKSATSTFTGQGVVVPFNKSEIDGETIQAQDLRLILEKTSREPAIDDVVTWQGSDYRIMSVEIASPGGVDIVYFCQLRV